MDENSANECRQLVYVLSAPPELRDQILANPPFSIVTAACEVALNLLHGSLELSEDDISLLKKYKRECETLAGAKKSFKSKLEVLALCDPEFLKKISEIISRYA